MQHVYHDNDDWKQIGQRRKTLPEGSLNCGERLGNETDFSETGKKRKIANDCEITQRTRFQPNVLTTLTLRVYCQEAEEFAVWILFLQGLTFGFASRFIV